jgi:RNA polymerase sigma factor (sigma-70 family)
VGPRYRAEGPAGPDALCQACKRIRAAKRIDGMEHTLVAAATLPASADAKGFEVFFTTTYPQVFRAALLVSHDHALAEDSTATAYLRAWERWSEVSVHAAPVAWVARVAINDSISWWRRARWRLASLAFADRSVATDFPDPDLQAALAGLPMRQRQVLALRVVLGLNMAETAAALGIAPGTVTAHLHRALQACRRRLEPPAGPGKGS